MQCWASTVFKLSRFAEASTNNNRNIKNNKKYQNCKNNKNQRSGVPGMQKALEGAMTFALCNGKQVILLTPLPVDVLGDLEATLRSKPNLPPPPPDFLLINQMPAARPQAAF